MAKTGPKPDRHIYKGESLTIDDFVSLPICQVGRVSVTNKLNKGMTMEEIAREGNKSAKGGATHPYKGGFITVNDFSRLPECSIPRTSVNKRLRDGMTLTEIAKLKFSKPRKKTKAKRKIKKVKELRTVNHRIKKSTQHTFTTEQAKEIMAVPVNPTKTQQHYMRATYIGTPDIEPTVLSSNGWMGRP